MSDVARMQQNLQHSMLSHDTQPSNDAREVAGIVARLLLHYYAAGDLSDSARRAMAQDWVEDLVEFGPLLVRDACNEWRRAQSRRPTPSDIRKLCIERQTLRQERAQLAAPTNADEYARSLGYESSAARVDAHRAAAEKARYLSSAENGKRLQAIEDEKGVYRTGPLKHAADAIGAVAREITHSPERMRADRIALGLELAEPAEAAE